jgi:dTDP-4-amino-4,6-dideoxygalactose transaminase
MAADMEKLCSVAETANIPLICDSAQALGTIFKGRSLLQWGDINVVSFHATKILAIGEGGAIVANDPVIVEEARSRSNFGFELRGGKGIVKTIGLNAKLAEMPAILGLAQLDRLDEMLEKRQNWAETYRQSLAGVPGLEFAEPREGCVPNNQVCTLKLTPEKFGMSPEVLVWALMQENVVCRVYFCPPMHRQPSFLQQGYRQPHDGLPATDQVCKTTISLPMQPDRQLQDAKIIAESVIRHHEKASEVNEAFFSSQEEA